MHVSEVERLTGVMLLMVGTVWSQHVFQLERNIEYRACFDYVDVS